MASKFKNLLGSTLFATALLTASAAYAQALVDLSPECGTKETKAECLTCCAKVTLQVQIKCDKSSVFVAVGYDKVIGPREALEAAYPGICNGVETKPSNSDACSKQCEAKGSTDVKK